MNELQAIVDVYQKACARGERMALATVVSVEGSAYRRPGARMLITESGQTVGTISGGCLESDVMERAAQVVETGVPRVIEYDTRGNEDIVWGLGLGCNGVVRVLLESLHEGSYGARSLQFINDCLHARRRGVMATIIHKSQTTNGESGEYKIGERFIVGDDEFNNNDQALAAGEFVSDISEDARKALMDGRSVMRSYESNTSQTEIFFDVIEPPRPLIVFGAEQDAKPLVRLAHTLGWHATIVDTRARRATTERFNEADAVVLCRAEDVAAQVSLTPDTAVVVMTHNYLHDVDLLRVLLPASLSYLGILGPKERTTKLLQELHTHGSVFTNTQLARLHSPIGIDIGAETPEEIALAIIAEIKAACALRRGGFLRDRNAPIHDDQTANLATIEFSVKPHRVQPASTTDRESAPRAACYLS
ncbi:MAG: xanthine dehydrogenase accessory factor [Acidobacteriota bacterium]|jgi:xanthine/CO dehydrogenase XdhC/CoxF family maturation factor|nr:xanthine dehydrogenase accessory factor [Acidobacteriota bacterium]